MATEYDDAIKALDRLEAEHLLWLEDEPSNSAVAVTLQQKFNLEIPPEPEQLDWERLKPVVKELRRLHGTSSEPITAFSNRRLMSANLSHGDLSGFSFCNCTFDTAFFDESCLDGAQFVTTALREASLAGVSCVGATFSSCDLVDCDLQEANLSDSSFFRCNFHDADLRMATLTKARLIACSFISANLSDALADESCVYDCDFNAATLIKTKFNGSTLTGMGLYGTARDDWQVNQVTCDYVYWDACRELRFPPQVDFSPGEFEQECRDYPSFTYTFTQGMTPFDLMLMQNIVDQINQLHQGLDLKLDQASVRGLNPTVRFVVNNQEAVATAEQEVKAHYDRSLNLMAASVIEEAPTMRTVEDAIQTVRGEMTTRFQAMLSEVLAAGARQVKRLPSETLELADRNGEHHRGATAGGSSELPSRAQIEEELQVVLPALRTDSADTFRHDFIECVLRLLRSQALRELTGCPVRQPAIPLALARENALDQSQVQRVLSALRLAKQTRLLNRLLYASILVYEERWRDAWLALGDYVKTTYDGGHSARQRQVARLFLRSLIVDFDQTHGDTIGSFAYDTKLLSTAYLTSQEYFVLDDWLEQVPWVDATVKRCVGRSPIVELIAARLYQRDNVTDLAKRLDGKITLVPNNQVVRCSNLRRAITANKSAIERAQHRLFPSR